MQMNRVVVAGFLAKKTERRFLPSGTPVTNARVGESSRYKNGNGEIKQHTNWHSLSLYGELANIALALEKGDNGYVDGGIEQREFTPRDGSKLRTVHEIGVTQFHVIAQLRNACKAHSPAETDEAPSVSDEVENDWPVGGLT
jgi:single-strand DNA-binding protein